MKAELFNFSCWVNKADPILLKSLGEELLNQSEFEVLNFMEHHFQPFGYTCIWLLAESHLAIHTFPEETRSYFELTSCVEYKKVKFRDLLIQKGIVCSEDEEKLTGSDKHKNKDGNQLKMGNV